MVRTRSFRFLDSGVEWGEYPVSVLMGSTVYTGANSQTYNNVNNGYLVFSCSEHE